MSSRALAVVRDKEVRVSTARGKKSVVFVAPFRELHEVGSHISQAELADAICKIGMLAEEEKADKKKVIRAKDRLNKAAKRPDVPQEKQYQIVLTTHGNPLQESRYEVMTPDEADQRGEVFSKDARMWTSSMRELMYTDVGAPITPEEIERMRRIIT